MYEELRRWFSKLGNDLGFVYHGLLDWTSISLVLPVVGAESNLDNGHEDESDADEELESVSTSYVGWGVDAWDVKEGRRPDLTLPDSLDELVDNALAPINEIARK